jgi:hypothetical protein
MATRHELSARWTTPDGTGMVTAIRNACRQGTSRDELMRTLGGFVYTLEVEFDSDTLERIIYGIKDATDDL